MQAPTPRTLDVRPICQAGGSPLGTILDTVDKLIPGQEMVLIAPFEPVPLYGVLAQRGFSYSSALRIDDAWEITFRPRPQII